jgi:hypothetical protein
MLNRKKSYTYVKTWPGRDRVILYYEKSKKIYHLWIFSDLSQIQKNLFNFVPVFVATVTISGYFSQNAPSPRTVGASGG